MKLIEKIVEIVKNEPSDEHKEHMISIQRMKTKIGIVETKTDNLKERHP